VKATKEKKRKRRHVPKITRSVLERVRMARGNRYYIMEGGGIDSLRGFGLEVGRAEAKYIIRKDGFPIIRLGLVHELTPEKAREQAAEKLRTRSARSYRPLASSRSTAWSCSGIPCCG
jgi:hypothetical protein